MCRRNTAVSYTHLDVYKRQENILIRATELGLGAVWLGMYPRQDRVDAIRKAFALPDRYVPFAAVPVGYPKKPLCPQDRFDDCLLYTSGV